MVSTAGAPVKTKAAGLNCPSCGASIALSTAGWSVTIVCSTCGSVLDAQDPNLRILQTQEQRLTVQPRIAMGTRGTWKGVQWDVVGCQQVGVTVDGTFYPWLEYVLFNPYQGFLYLTEYQGHWNVVEKLRRRPDVDAGNRDGVHFNGLTFKHFQSADAQTVFAIGEFPWEVNVGDMVRSHDYVSPPYMLSAEATEQEVTWSLGTYTDPKTLARAFGIKDLRSPVGVFSNQPNPHYKSARAIRRSAAFLILALAVMFVANIAMAGNEQVFSGRYKYTRSQGDTTAFVTDPFELKGRESNVDMRIETDLDQEWFYLNLALIDEGTGQAFDVGREVSYYSGRDSDGSWSEGSRDDHFKIGAVPSGKYILRVSPEGGSELMRDVNYTLTIKRDVPSYLFYGLAFIALFLPAMMSYIPAAAFEQRRWAESDHAPAASSSDDDDD